MKNAIIYTAPKLRPLPGEITDVSVREATLPMKIESARRAISNCKDLPELLRYQDQAQGLAAAVKVMKHVAPELVSSANRMCKEAIFRMGELLLQYNGQSRAIAGRTGRAPSERRHTAKEHGINEETMVNVTRLAMAPEEIRNHILSDDQIPARHAAMAFAAPRRCKPANVFSDSLRQILGSSRGGAEGLGRALYALRKIPMDAFALLTVDESKVVGTKITEIMEVLDEMDRRCRGKP